MSAEDATISQYWPTAKSVQIELANVIAGTRSEGIRTMLREMEKEADSQFAGIVGDRLLKVAALLDPRYKYNSKLGTADDWNEVEKDVVCVIKGKGIGNKC